MDRVKFTMLMWLFSKELNEVIYIDPGSLQRRAGGV